MLNYQYIQRINKELFIWPIALITLYFMNPQVTGNFSLCPFKWLGFPWCPGCGLGHGIHYFLHGQWTIALDHHLLSPFAVVMLIYRTLQLAWQQRNIKAGT